MGERGCKRGGRATPCAALMARRQFQVIRVPTTAHLVCSYRPLWPHSFDQTAFFSSATVGQPHRVVPTTMSRLLVRRWSGARPPVWSCRSSWWWRHAGDEIVPGSELGASTAQAQVRAGSTMCQLNTCRTTTPWGAMQGTFCALLRICSNLNKYVLQCEIRCEFERVSGVESTQRSHWSENTP